MASAEQRRRQKIAKSQILTGFKATKSLHRYFSQGAEHRYRFSRSFFPGSRPPLPVGWVAMLVERLLGMQLTGFEFRHLSKSVHGRHCKGVANTLLPVKKLQKNISKDAVNNENVRHKQNLQETVQPTGGSTAIRSVWG
jgi:hypothetical protein